MSLDPLAAAVAEFGARRKLCAAAGAEDVLGLCCGSRLYLAAAVVAELGACRECCAAAGTGHAARGSRGSGRRCHPAGLDAVHLRLQLVGGVQMGAAEGWDLPWSISLPHSEGYAPVTAGAYLSSIYEKGDFSVLKI